MHAALRLPLIRALLFCGLAAGTGASLAQQAIRGAERAGQRCGLIYTDHYGPYDYRTQRDPIKVVEDYHYTAPVQAAMGGATGAFGGDINYTLKASPNHHRALVSLVRWVARVKHEQTKGMEWPAECYFDRAIRFRPDDTVVRALYAQYLAKRQRQADAVNQIDVAVSFAGDSAFSHYNLGLVYLELNEPTKALQQAHQALAMGFPRTELAEALKKANQWQEPAAAAAEGAASAASSPRPASAAAAASASAR